MVVYSDKFLKAFDYVISNEGGYVFDKNDAGGETKYGISKKAYPALDIRALSLEDARKIYHRDFWLKGKFEQIEDKNVATQLFDFAVNFGLRAATICSTEGLAFRGYKKMYLKTV